MDAVSDKATRGPLTNGVETLTVKVGDDNIFVRKAGTGPPVLLLHGGACDSEDWVETMVPLAGSYTFYAPDLVGYGRSDRKRDGYRLSDFTASMVGLIKALNLNSPVAVVGHSLGGRVALDIALNYPDRVRRLALIDTTGFSRLARWGSFLGAMFFVVRRVLHRPQPFPRFIMDGDTDAHWVCLHRLPEIKIPSLIVWNRHDPYYTVKGALKAKKLMPQAQLEIVPGYGHAPHRTERESFNKLLAGFLAET